MALRAGSTAVLLYIISKSRACAVPYSRPALLEQDVQRELQQEKSEHQRDQVRAEELERLAAELRAAQAELMRKAAELERKAVGLTEEKSDLLLKVQCESLLSIVAKDADHRHTQILATAEVLPLVDLTASSNAQLEEMQAQHKEALKQNKERFREELETLKCEVAIAFQAFAEGSLTAESLLVRYNLPMSMPLYGNKAD